MRIGTNAVFEHRSPEEWADTLADMGFRAAAFPVDYTAPVQLIDQYVQAAKDRDILLAEVGVWGSPFQPDEKKAAKEKERILENLKLADYIRARCCVNVSGAFGEIWYFCYPENLTQNAYDKNVLFIRDILEKADPQHTCFCLEPMQWMLPTCAEETLRLLKDIDHPHFKVHMDICNLVNDPYKYTHMRELIDHEFDLTGQYIVSCHIKDILMEEGLTVRINEVLPGEGKMDIPYYSERIRQLGDPDMPALIEHLADKASYQKAMNYVSGL